MNSDNRACCGNAGGAGAEWEPLVPFALSPGLYVGRSPSGEDVAALAGVGFRSIINNRPDGEKGNLMTSVQIEAAARDRGLAYRYIPVEGRNPLETDVQAFAAALSTLPQPIYAYCRSGGRSASLWALASVTELTTGEIIGICGGAGFNVAWLEAKIDMRREVLEARGGDRNG
jgi:sulfide:quinone oxidoreductase